MKRPREVVSSLKAEADKLGALASNYDIRLTDGYALLKAPPRLTDLVFLDPPFAEARFEELFEALSRQRLKQFLKSRLGKWRIQED